MMMRIKAKKIKNKSEGYIVDGELIDKNKNDKKK